MTEVIHRRHYDEYEDEEDETLEEGLNEPPVELDQSLGNLVVVDHLPVVGEAKYNQLCNVIRKLFVQAGPLMEVDGLVIPRGEDGNTKGYGFVEYQRKLDAEDAIRRINGHQLDKSHVLLVNSFDDFAKLEVLSEEYKEPEPEPYAAKENLWSWLDQKRTVECNDEFVVRQGDSTEIYWNDTKGSKAQLERNIPNFTDTYVQWSPRGTYLASFHRQGVALSGGPSWKKVVKFSHAGVKLIDFSPCEKYLVTVAPQENEDPKDPKTIIVWEIATGRKLRGFTGSNSNVWPVFQWSFDDKYLARLGEDMLSVYETPSMNLLDKQSLKINGVKEFQWSPTRSVISYFVPEIGSAPARVVLVEIPSRKELRQKNFFGVLECKMHWQSEGRYLCVKADRVNPKNKKVKNVTFELFRVFEKDIGTESLEIKDAAHGFAWEPNGRRFAVIHGERSQNPDVSFYNITDTKLRLLKTLEKKTGASHLFWSPRGKYIILAGLKNQSGSLEFFNVDEMETMGTDEHPNCTAIEWDPTGTFAITSISYWRHQIDSGYNMYTFTGKLLYKIVKDRFCQILWRPRPPTLLSKEKIAEIEANMATYVHAFEEEDKKAMSEQKAADKAHRTKLRAKFNSLLAEREKELAEARKTFYEQFGTRRDPEADIEETTETVEELLDHYEEVV